MGIKTENYFSKKRGVFIHTAYAMIGDLVLNRKTNQVSVTFLIYESREHQENYDPIDEVKINFVWDRKKNIAQMAYNIAKNENHCEEVFNTETGKKEQVVKFGALYGWENDIVEGTKC